MNAHSCLLPVILLVHYQNTHSITHTLLQLTYQHTLPRYKYQYSLKFTIIINYCSTEEQARVPIIILKLLTSCDPTCQHQLESLLLDLPHFFQPFGHMCAELPATQNRNNNNKNSCSIIFIMMYSYQPV